MISKRVILEDLFLFRSKADVMYEDVYNISMLALKIVAKITPAKTNAMSNEDAELLAKIYRLVDLVNDANTNSSTYADSLVNEYRRVMKGINKL